MEIVWYVALLGQAAPVQAADEEELIVVQSYCCCEVDRSCARVLTSMILPQLFLFLLIRVHSIGAS